MGERPRCQGRREAGPKKDSSTMVYGKSGFLHDRDLREQMLYIYYLHYIVVSEGLTLKTTVSCFLWIFSTQSIIGFSYYPLCHISPLLSFRAFSVRTPG